MYEPAVVTYMYGLRLLFSSKSVELYLYLLFCSVEVLYDVKSIVQFQKDYRCRCLEIRVQVFVDPQLLSLVVQK